MNMWRYRKDINKINMDTVLKNPHDKYTIALLKNEDMNVGKSALQCTSVISTHLHISTCPCLVLPWFESANGYIPDFAISQYTCMQNRTCSVFQQTTNNCMSLRTMDGAHSMETTNKIPTMILWYYPPSYCSLIQSYICRKSLTSSAAMC